MLRAGATVRDYRILAVLDEHEHEPSRTARAQRGEEPPVVLKAWPLPPRTEDTPDRVKADYEHELRARLQSIMRVTAVDTAGQRTGARTALYDPWIADGMLYVPTAEFGDGTIGGRLAEAGARGLDLDVALDLAILCVVAVHAAHKDGAYHSNLKPHNFLVAPDGTSVCLTDFTLLESDPPRDQDSLTYTWAPERFSGENAYNASDLYSLGLVVYHLLAGEPPATCTSLEEAARFHLRGQLRPVGEQRPELHEQHALWSCLKQCLERDPARRVGLPGEGGTPQPPQTSPTLPALERLLAELRGVVDALHLRPWAAARPVDPLDRQVDYLPRLKVTLRDRVVFSREVRSDGLSVGGLGANDFQTQEPSLADTRLQVDWDGEVTWLTCSGEPAALSFQSGAIRPGTPYRWWPSASDAVVRAGPYQLAIEAPRLWQGRAQSVGNGEGTYLTNGAHQPEAALSRRLELRLEPAAINATPGVPAQLLLTVRSTGEAVGNVQFALEGVPSDWCQNLPVVENLLPGDTRSYQLAIVVPQRPESSVGVRRIVARATLSRLGNEYQFAVAQLTVQPYFGCFLELHPRLITGATAVRYRLLLQNTGNTEERFRLHADDPTALLAFDLGNEEVILKAGQRLQMALRVEPRPWHLWGAPRAYPFRVAMHSLKGEARATAEGRLEQQQLIPGCLPSLLLMLLLLFLLVTYLWRPYSQLDPDLGDWPLYGLFNPIPPSVTPIPSLTPGPLLVRVPPLVLATSSPTITPTATLTPTTTLTPAPMAVATTLTPTNTLTPTPAFTPTPAPVPERELLVCPREQPVLIEGAFTQPMVLNGNATLAKPYVLVFHDYPVSLGKLFDPATALLSGPDGRFVVPLIIGTAEQPGVYRVRVVAADGEVARTFFCQLLPPGVAPPPPPSPTSTPRPSATPFFSPTPIPTLAPGTPTLTPTPTTVPTPTFAPGLNGRVYRCPANVPIVIEGSGPARAWVRVAVNGVPLMAEFGPIGEDDRFRIEVPIPPPIKPGVVDVVVTTVDGEPLRQFFCDMYDAGLIVPATPPTSETASPTQTEAATLPPLSTSVAIPLVLATMTSTPSP